MGLIVKRAGFLVSLLVAVLAMSGCMAEAPAIGAGSAASSSALPPSCPPGDPQASRVESALSNAPKGYVAGEERTYDEQRFLSEVVSADARSGFEQLFARTGFVGARERVFDPIDGPRSGFRDEDVIYVRVVCFPSADQASDFALEGTDRNHPPGTVQDGTVEALPVPDGRLTVVQGGRGATALWRADRTVITVTQWSDEGTVDLAALRSIALGDGASSQAPPGPVIAVFVLMGLLVLGYLVWYISLLIDMLRYPDASWATAQQSRSLWLVLWLVGMCIGGGPIIGVIYQITVKPKLRSARDAPPAGA